MALRKVLVYPHPRLKQPAAPVAAIDTTIHALVQDMIETMYHEDGIGLAATQLGEMVRVAVIDVAETQGNPIVLINPEIVRAEGSISLEEGCLSIPGYRDYVPRNKSVSVKALNLEGKEFLVDGEDLLAVCLQHEIDHLNGVLFVDRIGFLKKQLFQKWISKRALAPEE